MRREILIVGFLAEQHKQRETRMRKQAFCKLFNINFGIQYNNDMIFTVVYVFCSYFSRYEKMELLLREMLMIKGREKKRKKMGRESVYYIVISVIISYHLIHYFFLLPCFSKSLFVLHLFSFTYLPPRT